MGLGAVDRRLVKTLFSEFLLLLALWDSELFDVEVFDDGTLFCNCCCDWALVVTMLVTLLPDIEPSEAAEAETEGRLAAAGLERPPPDFEQEVGFEVKSDVNSGWLSIIEELLLFSSSVLSLSLFGRLRFLLLSQVQSLLLLMYTKFKCKFVQKWFYKL